MRSERWQGPDHTGLSRSWLGIFAFAIGDFSVEDRCNWADGLRERCRESEGRNAEARKEATAKILAGHCDDLDQGGGTGGGEK